MASVLHMRVHQLPNSQRVMSIDLEKHASSVLESDVCADASFDLLQMPEPLSDEQLSAPSTLPPPPGDVRCVTPMLTSCVARPQSPRPGKLARAKRRKHNADTDRQLLDFVEIHGHRWRAISRRMGGIAAGWSDDVVRNRFLRLMHHKGTPYKTQRARLETAAKAQKPVLAWTEEEDKLIEHAVQVHGTAWQQVATYFQGLRTTQAVRNRASRAGLM